MVQLEITWTHPGGLETTTTEMFDSDLKAEDRSRDLHREARKAAKRLGGPMFVEAKLTLADGKVVSGQELQRRSRLVTD